MSAIVRRESVEGWTVGYATDEDEPRVRDVDLAERLGFANPLDIRKLIRRHEAAGNVKPFHQVATVATTAAVPRTAIELWLDQADALYITTKSETEKANAITKEMIRVFLAVQRGASRAFGERAEREIQRLSDRLDAIQRDQLEAATGMVGRVAVEAMRWAVETLATALRQLGRYKTLNGARSSVHASIRRHWGGKGKTIRNMPLAVYPHVMNELGMRIRDARDEAKARNADRQMSFDVDVLQ